VFTQRHLPASRLDNEEDGIVVDRQSVSALSVSSDYFSLVTYQDIRHAGFASIPHTVAVLVVKHHTRRKLLGLRR
jgi:hypothetical protein